MRRLATVGIGVVGVIATAALVLVLLLATGVLPATTERIVERQMVTTAGSSGVTQPASSTDDRQMTPTEIYRQYAPGVVEVLATFSGGSDFFGQSQSSEALGSGFVVSKDGVIITNAHVVATEGQQGESQRASSVDVVFKLKGTQTQRVPATILGVDNTSDVAVLKVDPDKAPALVPIPLGDSDGVQVGESVVAIGNPLGYDFSLTEGIVSATNRNLQSPNGAVIANGIQTDAAINSGNSGGPLINSRGQVIGVNEQIASQSGGNQGLGFAVPINTAINVMEHRHRAVRVARGAGPARDRRCGQPARAREQPGRRAGRRGRRRQRRCQGRDQGRHWPDHDPGPGLRDRRRPPGGDERDQADEHGTARRADHAAEAGRAGHAARGARRQDADDQGDAGRTTGRPVIRMR